MRTILWLLFCPVLFGATERSHDYDVQHYRIQLHFEESTRSFFGETTITLDPLRDGFDRCELDADTFRVTAVRASNGAAMRFEHKAPKLVVFFAKPLTYKERVSFTVVYEARNERVDPEKHGMAKDYPLGLDFGRSLIMTLSFPEGARHWFPCYDHPNDKASSEVIATVRDGYNAISNGKLVSVSNDPARHEKTFHWLQEKPHSTYLYVLVAGPYVSLNDSPGKMPVRYWVRPDDTPDARRTFGPAREMIRFFERKLGVPFPWDKYDQIAIPGIGGGAESTSATVEGESLLHDEKGEKDFSSHSVVSHEIAHQWWGDLITMRDWGHAWLNESFASYYQYLYAKSTLGEDEGAWDLEQKRQRYRTEAATKYSRPIVWDKWELPNQNFDRHSYEKGAAVLHMLAWVMGEANFDHAVTHFLKKHAYQSVDTHDLQIAIRESTGQVLDWFFDEWVYRAGHPVFVVQQEWSKGKLILRVGQKQAGAFQTPVDIGITTAKGKRVEHAWIRKQEEVIEIACPEEPLLVRFDEGNHILMELEFPKSQKELLYQLQYDDALGRMNAASHVTDQNALQLAVTSDPFWALRRAALRQLKPDRGFFKSRDSDANSLVRADALSLLAASGDRSLLPYFQERYAKEDSYLAQAQAIRAIGKFGGREVLVFLQEAQRLKSPRDVIANAARDALQNLH